MAKFVCDHCHSVENTALGGFWNRRRFAKWFGKEYEDKALCSRCLPNTTLKGEKIGEFGRWHNRFKQEIATKEWALVYNDLACTKPTQGLKDVLNGVKPKIVYPGVTNIELKAKGTSIKSLIF